MSWNVKPLGELAETQLGKMLNSSKQTGRHSRPYLRNVNVQWGWFDMSDVKSMDIFPDEESKFLARKGDLLICEGGEVGRCAVWTEDEPVGIQNAVHRVRVSSDLDTTYLRHYLQHLALAGGLEPYSSGVTIKHLTQEKLRRIPISYPPLDEQKRIVTQLEDQLAKLETARTKLRRVDALLPRLQESALFSEHVIAGLALAPLGEIAEVKGGKRLPKGMQWNLAPNHFPYIRAQDIGEGKVRLDNLVYVPAPAQRTITNYRVAKGDVLITIAGSIGRTAVVPPQLDGANLTENAARIVGDPALVDPFFLESFLRSPIAQSAIASLTRSTSQPKLAIYRIKEIVVPLPPISQQREIMERVHQSRYFTERARDAVTAADASIDSARSSILHRAFSAPEEAL